MEHLTAKEKKDVYRLVHNFIRVNNYPTQSTAVLKCRDKVYNYKFNCYGYIFGFTGEQYDRFDDKYNWILGFSDEKYENITSYEDRNIVEKMLKSDFKFLKLRLNLSDEQEKIEDGEIKFALYACDKDFHFVRQNADGTWSHKRGWIQEPETLDLDRRQGLPRVLKLHRNYELIGIYKAKMKYDKNLRLSKNHSYTKNLFKMIKPKPIARNDRVL